MPTTVSFDQILEVEEYLQDEGCFYCMMDPDNQDRRPHPDSYGTIFDPKCLPAEMAERFDHKVLAEACQYWWENPNVQIPLTIAAATIAAKIGYELVGSCNRWGETK